MEILLAAHHLGLGGSESYLITVAEQLDRLGHGVTIFSPEGGAGVGVALERGLEVVEEASLPEDCDAALVQDGVVSHLLAARLPALPQLFVAHSEIFDLQAPPQLEGAVGAVVAMNDRVAARMRSFAVETEVVRLRQPIDAERFVPRGSLPPIARHALLLSNNSQGDRIGMLEAACAEVGLELTRLGGSGGQATDIRPAIANADVVIGYGRSVLEAMACGRAAYVYDWTGGDGWVTADSYAAIEAGGFGGRSGRSTPDGAELIADLRRYDAAMGSVNRDLAMAHHRANVHTQELVELFGRIASPPARPREPLREMSRLVRLEWRARFDLAGLIAENAHLREALKQTEARLRAQRDADLRTQRQDFERSASWRLTRPLRALGQRRPPATGSAPVGDVQGESE